MTEMIQGKSGVYVLPPDYDEAEFEISEEQQIFEQFANEARDNEQYSKMTVSRVPMNRHGQRGAQKLSFLFEAGIDEYSYSQLLSKLRDEYGSGFYKIQARNDKGHLKLNKTVAVEAPTEDTDKATADNGSGVIAQVSETLARQTSETRDLISQLAHKPQTDPIDTIVKVAGAVAPILTALGISRPEPVQQKTLVDQIAELKILQEFMGGDNGGNNGEANLYSLLGDTMKAFGGPLAAALANGAASGELNEDGTLAAPALPEPEKKNPTVSEEAMNKVKHENSMRKQVNILVMNAKTGVDPVMFAGVVVNATPEDQQDALWEFISAEYCVDELINMEPSAEPYREWFDKLREAVITIMADPEDENAAPVTEGLQDDSDGASIATSDAVAGEDVNSPHDPDNSDTTGDT